MNLNDRSDHKLNMIEEDERFNFGKHKGERIIDHLDYVKWIMKQKNTSNQMKEIQEKYKDMPIYDINELRSRNKPIHVSLLCEYVNEDESVKNIIQKLTIYENDVRNIHRSNEIDASTFGQFIDYLLRYEVSLFKKESFEDTRCEMLDINCELVKCEDGFKSISPDVINIIFQSYNKMKKGVANIKDILNVSLSQSIAFRRGHVEKYININEQITPEDRNTLKTYIQKKISNVSNDHILCNPGFSNSELCIHGDADLIIEEELLDFKVSQIIGNNRNDFIQLIIYAVLHSKINHKLCKKLTIYNPLLAKEFFINIDENIIDLIFEKIKSYRICSEYDI